MTSGGGPSPGTTEGEIDFIQKLGTHRLPGTHRRARDSSPRGRLLLLENYERGIATRTKWGKIDPSLVKAELLRLINGLRAELELPVGAMQ